MYTAYCDVMRDRSVLPYAEQPAATGFGAGGGRGSGGGDGGWAGGLAAEGGGAVGGGQGKRGLLRAWGARKVEKAKQQLQQRRRGGAQDSVAGEEWAAAAASGHPEQQQQPLGLPPRSPAKGPASRQPSAAPSPAKQPLPAGALPHVQQSCLQGCMRPYCHVLVCVFQSAAVPTYPTSAAVFADTCAAVSAAAAVPADPGQLQSLESIMEAKWMQSRKIQVSTALHVC